MMFAFLGLLYILAPLFVIVAASAVIAGVIYSIVSKLKGK